jgi:hypothetical protein
MDLERIRKLAGLEIKSLNEVGGLFGNGGGREKVRAKIEKTTATPPPIVDDIDDEPEDDEPEDDDKTQKHRTNYNNKKNIIDTIFGRVTKGRFKPEPNPTAASSDMLESYISSLLTLQGILKEFTDDDLKRALKDAFKYADKIGNFTDKPGDGGTIDLMKTNIEDINKMLKKTTDNLLYYINKLENHYNNRKN